MVSAEDDYQWRAIALGVFKYRRRISNMASLLDNVFDGIGNLHGYLKTIRDLEK
jgi:hypothetical protein